MQKLQNQLKSISTSLVKISKQLEEIAKQADKLQPSKTEKKDAGKTPIKKKDAKQINSKPQTVMDQVFEIIKRSRKGVNLLKLREKTKLSPKQLSNTLYKLSKKEKIKSIDRGHYVKA